MELFDSTKQKYVTRGIDEHVPIEIQMILFSAIEKWRQEGKIDYLQVFDCKVVSDDTGNPMQIINHTQEVPEKSEVIQTPVIEKGITDKIFVIDDGGEYFTMLFSYEY